jgi:hypothetical protein
MPGNEFFWGPKKDKKSLNRVKKCFFKYVDMGIIKF